MPKSLPADSRLKEAGVMPPVWTEEGAVSSQNSLTNSDGAFSVFSWGVRVENLDQRGDASHESMLGVKVVSTLDLKCGFTQCVY